MARVVADSLLLLDKIEVERMAQVLFLFWRAWHLRNDATYPLHQLYCKSNYIICRAEKAIIWDRAIDKQPKCRDI